MVTGADNQNQLRALKEMCFLF